MRDLAILENILITIFIGIGNDPITTNKNLRKILKDGLERAITEPEDDADFGAMISPDVRVHLILIFFIKFLKIIINYRFFIFFFVHRESMSETLHNSIFFSLFYFNLLLFFDL